MPAVWAPSLLWCPQSQSGPLAARLTELTGWNRLQLAAVSSCWGDMLSMYLTGTQFFHIAPFTQFTSCNNKNSLFHLWGVDIDFLLWTCVLESAPGFHSFSCVWTLVSKRWRLSFVHRSVRAWLWWKYCFIPVCWRQKKHSVLISVS